MNRSTRAAQLLLDGEATAVSRKAVELALAVELVLPPINSAADILGAIKAVADAVGRGGITPAEGFALSQMIESLLRAIDASDFDNRLRQLEDAQSEAVQILMGIRPAKDLGLSHTLGRQQTDSGNGLCYCAPSRRLDRGFPRRSEADRSIFAAKNS